LLFVTPGTIQFRLLGEVEVLVGGNPVSLGGAKQRALLALLLLERGTAVSTDRLIEAIWSGRPPETAQKSVQVYVSGLRKALGEGRILTRGRGYELTVEPGELDVDDFDRLVREAADAPPEVAAARLREGLALVRGRPLADVALEPWAAPEIDRLEERILAATEARIEADLEFGRHGDLVPELERLVDQHPYREHLLELLMLALYRSGRQAEALDAYRRRATRLRDELGLEPSRPLQQLEASILQQDEALDAPSAARRLQVRRRSWKVVTAGAVAVVAAAAAATAIALTRGSSVSLESLPPGVAVISATDGSLVGHIPNAEIPEPSEVVTGNGHFWVWGLHPFQLVEIDPKSGHILRHVSSPFAGDAAWYLPDGRNVWFTAGRELVRVDAAEGRAVDRYRLTKANNEYGLNWLTRCFGSLWVTDNPDSLVLRVDPASGRVQARIHAQYPAAIACGDGGLWVSWWDKGLHRIDPRTNRIVATASTPAPFVNVLAVGGGFAWASNEAAGTVSKIDRGGTVVAVYETGDGAHQMSFSGGRLWVANQDVGTVTGIDAATGARTTFAFGHPVQSVASQSGRLLVELREGLTFEDRIAALKGNVARLIVPTYVFDPIDPALAWNPWAFMAERATCAGLVQREPGSNGRISPDLASALPSVSADGLTYSFTVRHGRRFAPPSNAPVTVEDVRASIERAMSPKLGSAYPGAPQPGALFLDDLVGAKAFRHGATHVRGIVVNGDAISLTLFKPSKTFLQRLALPFFCTVPAETPRVQGGLTNPPPSAGPYYVSDGLNGEYQIMKRNPNYTGPRPAHLDAIAFREGISPEHAVARVRSGTWDAALLPDELLAPGGDVAWKAQADPRTRTEELPARNLGIAFARAKGFAVHALLSTRLGCDTIRGALDLAALCTPET
jgi:DNA-binding SARP family transcriptional activator